MNPIEDKLNIIVHQNEQLVMIVASLVRTLEKKGVFTKQDFAGCAAFGKQLDLNNLVFDVGKK